MHGKHSSWKVKMRISAYQANRWLENFIFIQDSRLNETQRKYNDTATTEQNLVKDLQEFLLFPFCFIFLE